MIRTIKKTLVVVFFSLIFFSEKGIYAELRNVRSFRIKGRVLKVVSIDINGDKLPDLICMSSVQDHSDLKYFSLFYNSAQAGLPYKPDKELKIQGVSDTFTVTDVTGDEGKEIIFQKDKRLKVLSFGNDTLFNLIDCLENKDALYLRENQIIKVKGSKKELHVYTPSTIIIFHKRSGVLTFEEIPYLWGRPLTPILLLSRLPVVFRGRIKGKNRIELMTVKHDKIQIFDTVQNTRTWSLVKNEPDTTLFFGVDQVSEEEVLSEKKNLLLEDINSDGFTDVIFVRVVKTVSFKERRELYVYLNKSGVFSINPDNIFISEGLYTGFVTGDINNDGTKDIVTYSIPLDYMQIPAYVTGNKLLVRFKIYPCKKKSGFSKRALEKVSFKISTNILKNKEIKVSISGDFNKDGFRDLMLLLPWGKMKIFLNNQQGGFNEKEFIVAAVPANSRFIINDFNNDRAEDIMLWNSKQIILMLLNRR